MSKQQIYEVIIYAIFIVASMISTLGIIWTIIRDRRNEDDNT
jgi:hypothetical protein